MTTIRTSVLGLLLGTATVLAGSAIARAEDQITLGAIVPSSGPFAEWGRANTTTLNFLEKQVNEAGGIGGKKLKIVIYDDNAKPARSRQRAAQARRRRQGAGDRGPADQQRLRGEFPGRQRNEDRFDLASLLQAGRRQSQPPVGVPQHRRRRHSGQSLRAVFQEDIRREDRGGDLRRQGRGLDLDRHQDHAEGVRGRRRQGAQRERSDLLQHRRTRRQRPGHQAQERSIRTASSSAPTTARRLPSSAR